MSSEVKGQIIETLLHYDEDETVRVFIIRGIGKVGAKLSEHLNDSFLGVFSRIRFGHGQVPSTACLGTARRWEIR